ncbi:cysteine-rich with EGF-like domain protein 2 isoform X1 [Homarus americanus]|uniref:Cysteine-rich with EGF-like domain protein 2-like n=1 Tax=Homarus americanus TaxID=6706 RepID=A0A8J5JDG6_HOMAM|nr:cysteine-rich with EGF-like domain protein 2 isoform X1 [Homarus americanus]KAG7154691.1 Cysteine-rich with EGF-like domain protein 2-like [Homarus americanus]
MQSQCRKEILLLLVVGLSCLVAQVIPDTSKSKEGSPGSSNDGDKSKNNNSKENLKSAKLPPCASCKTLTESFKKGIESTARGKFEGGDSAWEEEKMMSYKKSEVRLIEIQEKLCRDVERGQKQCEAGAEEHEGLLEDWWFREQETQPDLHTWLCIDTLRVCCPTNHYGPRCLPCKGGIENPCGGNGKCKGAGTRKGSGDCSCNPGYKGDMCDACTYGYYEAYKDDTKLLCEQCHKACNGPCSGPGQKSCAACKEGWLMDTEKGCLDINECAVDKTPCKRNQFCINNEGSYSCLECDKACDGCSGDGPDMCDKCAEGYKLDKDLCVDNSAQERDKHMTFARYVTYAGLTLATCIILQKNTIIAAIVGVSVAVYISFSEYYLKDTPAPPVTPQLPSSLFSQDIIN